MSFIDKPCTAYQKDVCCQQPDNSCMYIECGTKKGRFYSWTLTEELFKHFQLFCNDINRIQVLSGFVREPDLLTYHLNNVKR